MKWLYLLLGILLPFPAWAAVSISEVAWMGSVESANYEWIELHNDGEATDVSGWVLNDGMNLSIELSGNIPAGQYVVLERSSDESAVGNAFLIYTGALVNTGATLKLMRADGSLVDQVSGGENWQNIGGDNTTKETAQYTSGGWVTAKATPGASAPTGSAKTVVSNSEEEVATKTTTSKTSTKKVSKSEPMKLELPDVTLKLNVEAQTLGYVNQSINFSVTPSGIGESLIDSLQYQWNFGDGLISNTKEASHVFSYPGTYVVTVVGEFKRQKQVSRHEITILPVEISLTKNQAGDIQVNNDSPYEIDVSGYKLAGNKGFEFPPYSVILPNQTVTIPRKKITSGGEAMVALYDTEKILVASQLPNRFNEPISASLAMAYTDNTVEPIKKISATANSRMMDLSVVGETDLMTEEVNEIIVDDVEPTSTDYVSTTSQLATVSATDIPTNERWIYVALASTMLVGVFGVYAAPKRNVKQSDLVK